MSTSIGRSPHEQKAYEEGFNIGIELAAKRVEKTNSDAAASIRGLMLDEGPTRADIDAMLGI